MKNGSKYANPHRADNGLRKHINVHRAREGWLVMGRD
jgi:hypothetical protein